MIRIFSDTDCDIVPAIAKKYNVTLISMPFVLDDKEIYPYKDEDTFDFHAYYQQLRDGKMATTNALNEENYISIFEPVLAAGDDIFYIHFSRAMTASFDSMDSAIKILKEKYPERRIIEADTKGITLMSYIVLMEALDNMANGMSPDDCCQWVNDNALHYACYFFADDLKFFKRSGRVSGLAAFFGGMIGIKPIITMDENGIMKSVGKVKGRINAIKELINKMEELGDDIKNHRIMIGHVDNLELAKEVGKELNAKFGDLDVEYVCVNPTAGAHCGPDTIGVAFHSIHR